MLCHFCVWRARFKGASIIDILVLTVLILYTGRFGVARLALSKRRDQVGQAALHRRLHDHRNAALVQLDDGVGQYAGL